MEKIEISHRILAYLVDHPKAKDTLRGVMDWWLLDREMNYQKEEVEKALNELLANGFVLLHRKIYYRVNMSKYDEIQQFLGQIGK